MLLPAFVPQGLRRVERCVPFLLCYHRGPQEQAEPIDKRRLQSSQFELSRQRRLSRKTNAASAARRAGPQDQGSTGPRARGLPAARGRVSVPPRAIAARPPLAITVLVHLHKCRANQFCRTWTREVDKQLQPSGEETSATKLNDDGIFWKYNGAASRTRTPRATYGRTRAVGARHLTYPGSAGKCSSKENPSCSTVRQPRLSAICQSIALRVQALNLRYWHETICVCACACASACATSPSPVQWKGMTVSEARTRSSKLRPSWKHGCTSSSVLSKPALLLCKHHCGAMFCQLHVLDL